MSRSLVVCLLVVAGAALAWWALAGKGPLPGWAPEAAPAGPGVTDPAAAARPVVVDEVAARAEGPRRDEGTPPPGVAPEVGPSAGPARTTPGAREPEFAPEESAGVARRPSTLTTDPEPAAVEPAEAESVARAALRFVGKDQAAEAIWLRAINDPGLPAGVRSDLIEDLNDEGYSNPDRATQADLPLILKRLELIERLAPFALDEVNRTAFEEAYKDLLAMLIRLRGEKQRT